MKNFNYEVYTGGTPIAVFGRFVYNEYEKGGDFMNRARLPETEPLLAMRIVRNILKARGKHGASTFFEVHGLSPEEALRLIHSLEMDNAVEEAKEHALDIV